jgi:peroxiredoxin family protein
MPDPSVPPDRRSPDKLSIVVFSGDFDRIHYALVMASAALAVDTPVTLFFTQWALRALARPQKDGSPGWHGLPVSQGRATAAELDAGFAEKKVATFEELLEACAALGARFMVCEMGARAIGMDRGEFRDDIDIESGGFVTFLGDASKDGSIIFV